MRRTRWIEPELHNHSAKMVVIGPLQGLAIRSMVPAAVAFPERTPR